MLCGVCFKERRYEMDIPANWTQTIESVDWSQIAEKVEDYGPAISVLRETWSKETLQEMAAGKVFVPDDVLNEAIKKQIPADGNVAAIRLHGQENGRLYVRVETRKKDAVELTGEIKEFCHRGDTSYMVYHVRERNLPGHGLMSWVFSRISLSMAERLVGRIETPEGIPVTIHGNTVRVDCSAALSESDFGKTEFQGHRLLDMVEIDGARPKEGGIELQTKLDVPDDVQDALKNVLKEKAEASE